MKFQGVTIECPNDDIGLEYQGDNFGLDGHMYCGHNGILYYGHPVREFYGMDVRKNFVELEGRFWFTKPRAWVV